MASQYNTLTINGFTLNYSIAPKPEISVKYDGKLLQTAVRQPKIKVDPFDPLRSEVQVDESVIQLSDMIFETIQELCNDGKNCVAALFASHFYESFTIFDNELKIEGRHILSIPLWLKILELVNSWEEKHGGVKIHTGTPLYFLSVSYLQTNNNDSAFIYLIKSIHDDIELAKHCPEIGYPQTQPAYRTVSLIDNPGNYMHSFIVQPLRAQLKEAIKKYHDLFDSESRLSEMQELDSKFLLKHDPDLELIKQLFVLELIKLLQLRNITTARLKIVSPFIKMLLLNRLFSLTLVVDKLLYANYLPTDGNEMYACVKSYAKTHGIAEAHIQALKINKLSTEVVMQTLLEKRSQNSDNLPREMFPILIAYKIRNTSAHNIHAVDVLYDRYDEILQSILEAVFIIVGQIPA